MIDETFFLARIENMAHLALETAVKKHLKNEFENKIIPKIIKDLKKDLIVTAYQETDNLGLEIKLKRGKDE